jgi:hypothetical protein
LHTFQLEEDISSISFFHTQTDLLQILNLDLLTGIIIIILRQQLPLVAYHSDDTSHAI